MDVDCGGEGDGGDGGGCESNKNILRHLNADFSIRKGKYGSYIFYKTATMKKPQFLKLKFKDPRVPSSHSGLSKFSNDGNAATEKCYKGFAGVDGDKFWYMNLCVDDVLSRIRENYNL
jgi:hypothetical protein